MLDLPIHSPITHGMPQIKATLKDDVISDAQVILGSMHRGVEKLFESRDYRQILMLANRHEWLSPITGEVGLAELLEQALGITVPDQAVTLRRVLIHYSRITSHLAFLSGFPFEDAQLITHLRAHREELISHQQKFIGNRMHPMITRIGGFTHSPDSTWLATTTQVTRETADIAHQVTNYLQQHPALTRLGILSESSIAEFGLSGPVAAVGGVSARLNALVDDINSSVNVIHDLVPELIRNINEAVNVLLPKVPRIPEGEYTHSINTPLGTAMWFMVSRGDKMPYRLKLRPASLHTVLAMGQALEGVHITEAKYVVASMPFITGDAER